MAVALQNDETDALEALSELVEQIRDGKYRDHRGHPLDMNEAYREALVLLLMRGRLPS